MKTERFILSFITILIGLLVAGTAFYFYQMSSSKQVKKDPIILSLSPTPAQLSTQLFQIDAPSGEEVVSKKVIQVKGKAVPGTTITVLSDGDFSVTKATEKNEFTTDFTLKNGVNALFITAMFPNGEEATMQKTVTYSTEDF